MTAKSGFYAETNFKEVSELGKIPAEWEVVQIGDVLSLEYGSGLPDRERTHGPYPVVGSNGIIGYHSKAIVKGPGIVVGRKGSIGAVSWIDSDFWPIDTTFYVKIETSNIFLKWLFYELVYLNLGRFRLADVVPGLKRELVHSLKMPLPPFSEQQKIAEILSTVDEAIQKTDEVIATSERLKKGLMQELLTKGIGHKEFKDTEIGGIPKEWGVVKLGEIGTFQYGITASAKEEDTGVKFLRITDIRDNGTINWSEVPFCEISISELSKYMLKVGDVLFARIGATTGKTCNINREIRGVFGSYLIRFLPDVNSQIDTKFIHLFTQSEMYWLQVNRMKGGQLKKGLNTQLLKEIKIPLPPLEEQRKIIQVLSTVDKKLEIERNEKAKLERIRKGLIDLLLTGKIRIRFGEIS
jgi:type I restriction enzyme S subunit